MNKSKSSKRYRLILRLLPVIIPGLIISGIGVFFISQQKKTKKIQIEERYQLKLEQLHSDIEAFINSEIERAFLQMMESQIQFNQNISIQKVLKQIIINNPIVKYPFIINSRGDYIFPFFKKSAMPMVETSYAKFTHLELKKCFQKAEQLELEDRKFWEALKLYAKCLQYNEAEVLEPFIFIAMGRCYFKLKKYPQARSYFGSVIDSYDSLLTGAKDFSLNFFALRQMAICFQREGNDEKAMQYFLQLYDEILEYETSHSSEQFAFFKNHAQEFLNQYIRGKGKTVDSAQFEPYKKNGRRLLKDRLIKFGKIETALSWRFYRFVSPTGSDQNKKRGNVSSSTEMADQTFDEKSRYKKIQEFYLTADEKTKFYSDVRKFTEWDSMNSKNFDTNIASKKITEHLSNEPIDVVFRKIPINESGKGNKRDSVFFGFQLSPNFLKIDAVKDIIGKYIKEKSLKVSFSSVKNFTDFRGSLSFPYPLLFVKIDKYYNHLSLVLVSKRENFFDGQARREIRLNYFLMGVFILVFIVGTYLFYKYHSREVELVQMKSDFTDSASHTLKTPLTRIRILAEKLQLGWVSNEEKKQEYLKAILTETDRMNEMIMDMLDFSKIESGGKKYHFELLSLSKLVDKILQSHGSYLENIGFQINAEIADNLPILMLDADAVRIILVNLLQNAVKYSHGEKYIMLRLFFEKEHVVLEVKDRGIGIEKREMDKIFNRFYRGANPTVQMKEGSGLGLFLVQHAVQAHGGMVTVDSEPGKGSCFVIRFPIKTTIAQKELEKRSSHEENGAIK